jgi:hypothetical protein
MDRAWNEAALVSIGLLLCCVLCPLTGSVRPLQAAHCDFEIPAELTQGSNAMLLKLKYSDMPEVLTLAHDSSFGCVHWLPAQMSQPLVVSRSVPISSFPSI